MNPFEIEWDSCWEKYILQLYIILILASVLRRVHIAHVTKKALLKSKYFQNQQMITEPT